MIIKQDRRAPPPYLPGPPQHGAVVLVKASDETYLMHETTCDECISTSNGEIRRLKEE